MLTFGRKNRGSGRSLQPYLQLPCCQNLQTVIAHPLQAQLQRLRYQRMLPGRQWQVAGSLMELLLLPLLDSASCEIDRRFEGDATTCGARTFGSFGSFKLDIWTGIHYLISHPLRPKPLNPIGTVRGFFSPANLLLTSLHQSRQRRDNTGECTVSSRLPSERRPLATPWLQRACRLTVTIRLGPTLPFLSFRDLRGRAILSPLFLPASKRPGG